MNLLLDSGPLVALVGIVAGILGTLISYYFERVVKLQKTVLKDRDELLEKSVGIRKVFQENINELTGNPDFDLELRKASRRIRLFSTTGDSLISREYLTLKHLLEKGLRIQVMLLDPESDPKQLADRAVLKEHAEHSTSMLLELGRAAKHEGQLELRFYSTPQSYSILFIDDLLFVSLFAQGSGQTRHSPTLLIKDDGTSLYKFFDTSFEQSWSIANPIHLDRAT